MTFTITLQGVLTAILLIALIVLVVFLIVLVSNVTDTIKKANAIIDGGTNAAGAAKEKVDNVNAMVKERASQVTGVAKTGLGVAQKILGKVLK